MAFLNETHWDPCKLLLSSGTNFKYALLILNTPIKLPLKGEQVLDLWNNALVRITVDGGTDQWLTWLQNNFKGSGFMDPDFVTGDMDSISPETLSHYESSCVDVVHTQDQNETDFTKALLELQKRLIEQNLMIDYVIVFNSVEGRFDHLVANVNTLYKMDIRWPKIQIFMVSNCITWLLAIGKHKIKVPLKLQTSREWCALIPFGSKATVSTSGLKWNLDGSPLEFGHVVSTSNTYAENGEEVSIATDTPIIWSMGIEHLLGRDEELC